LSTTLTPLAGLRAKNKNSTDRLLYVNDPKTGNVSPTHHAGNRRQSSAITDSLGNNLKWRSLFQRFVEHYNYHNSS
ncbi:MAG: hypothetical protein LBE12_00665, partial [Planctomycetaceae bacterium]|nr:hypothetical protein [Planctomycetaceae bacterium]